MCAVLMWIVANCLIEVRFFFFLRKFVKLKILLVCEQFLVEIYSVHIPLKADSHIACRAHAVPLRV